MPTDDELIRDWDGGEYDDTDWCWYCGCPLGEGGCEECDNELDEMYHDYLESE